MSPVLNHFAKSTGQSANKEKGSFSGKLLGKMAEGFEALEALCALAHGHANRFMELAQAAVKTYAKKLEAAATIPFATPDLEFNAAINPAKAAAPTLTPGGGSARKKKRSDKQEE